LNKNDIRKRLIEARQSLPGEVNPRQFALKAESVDTSQYAKYEKGGPLGFDKIVELCSSWGINTDWLQTGKGEIFLSSQNKLKEEASKSGQHFTPDQLFQMYMKAMERQDKIMEAQTVILTNIESKMARGDALADVAKNLQRVLGGLETVADKQTDAIKEFRADLKEIKSQKKVPS